MRYALALPTLLLVSLLLAPGPARAQEDPAVPEADAAVEHDCGDHEVLPEDFAQNLADPVRMDDAGQGSLLLRTDHPGLYVPAPALATGVAIRATGIVARTTVTQRFRNPTGLWVEGVYVFPLPDNAAVDGLRMVIGDRVIEGHVQEREEARQTYEEAKSQGSKASLVEQQRPNLFTTAVANLGPDEEVEVVIEYQQELRYDAGVFSLRFPMAVTPRYEPAAGLRTAPSAADPPVPGLVLASLAGVQDAGAAGPPPEPALLEPPRDAAAGPEVTLVVELEPGFPLARLTSPSHAIRKRKSGPLAHWIELEAGAVPADRDFVLEWQPAAGATPQASLFLQEGEDSRYGLLMVMPPADLAAAKLDLPREVIFVVDTSGSMAGASIGQAREALDDALARLEPRDFFNVIEFNSEMRRLFPRSVPAGEEAVDHARAFVSGLNADGGTEMLPALRAALAGSGSDTAEVRQLVFITDGAVGNEQELFAHIQAHLGESRLFTVGIGSAPNSYFMTRAAELGRGTFTFIGSPEEVRKKMGGLFRKLERPVLTGVEIAWDDAAAEAYPPRIPDLYAGEPILVAVRLQPGAKALKVSGRAAGAFWEVPLPAVESAPGAGLDKLWARRRIEDLERQLTGAGLPEAIRQVHDAIVELGRTYHLVTRFTSLVAVDITPARPAGEQPKTVLLPVHPPAGWQEEGGALPAGGTPAPLALLLGTLLLAAGLWLWRSRHAAEA